MVSVEKILYIEVDCPNYNGLVQLATSGQVFGLLFRTVLAPILRKKCIFTSHYSHFQFLDRFKSHENQEREIFTFPRNLSSINLLLYFMVFIVDITVCDAVKV